MSENIQGTLLRWHVWSVIIDKFVQHPLQNTGRKDYYDRRNNLSEKKKTLNVEYTWRTYLFHVTRILQNTS